MVENPAGMGQSVDSWPKEDALSFTRLSIDSKDKLMSIIQPARTMHIEIWPTKHINHLEIIL